MLTRSAARRARAAPACGSTRWRPASSGARGSRRRGPTASRASARRRRSAGSASPRTWPTPASSWLPGPRASSPATTLVVDGGVLAAPGLLRREWRLLDAPARRSSSPAAARGIGRGIAEALRGGGGRRRRRRPRRGAVPGDGAPRRSAAAAARSRVALDVTEPASLEAAASRATADGLRPPRRLGEQRGRAADGRRRSRRRAEDFEAQMRVNAQAVLLRLPGRGAAHDRARAAAARSSTSRATPARSATGTWPATTRARRRWSASPARSSLEWAERAHQRQRGVPGRRRHADAARGGRVAGAAARAGARGAPRADEAAAAGRGTSSRSRSGRVVAFLLSDAAAIIRGQSINVDGGDTPY